MKNANVGTTGEEHEDDNSRKRRHRGNTDYFWLTVCSIGNIRNWHAAVNMWHLWTMFNANTQVQSCMYGLSIFDKYKHGAERWNDGRSLTMSITNIDFRTLKTKVTSRFPPTEGGENEKTVDKLIELDLD